MDIGTANRVERNTSQAVNERIRLAMRRRVSRYAAAPEADLRRRLSELDEEWDIERALEANASIAVMTSLALGRLVDRRLYAVAGAVAGFLFKHAVSGWCPPLPVLRRLGFRTVREIEEERRLLETALRSRAEAEKEARSEP
ncbi:MAG: hypothetical protein M0D55_14505 [Elusimicrobiota bacterium]|nr:MAG: hypothetical protein M0D55_14505 [Elusimicrobiota bacterium]